MKKAVMQNVGQPQCSYCGGLHYGSPLGKCVYQCEHCKGDIRDDADGFGHAKCECDPIAPMPRETRQCDMPFVCYHCKNGDCDACVGVPCLCRCPGRPADADTMEEYY
jgi:hypothetical protein